ncbi:MAG: hypothetical protein IE917_01170 [Betaproteobacteria bacterium]|nr:hypothetical protein [Betaproteobacteria bacterium]
MTGNNASDESMDAYINFGPILSHKEMMKLDADASGWGTVRRICLTTCTRDAAMLRNLNAEFPEAFDEVFKSVENFKEHAKRLLDIAEAASLRMQIASNAAID